MKNFLDELTNLLLFFGNGVQIFKQKLTAYGLCTFISFCSQLAFGQFTPEIPSIQAGSGWGSSGNTPFGGNTTAYSDLKDQYILLASDLSTGGLVANDVLASIGFYVSGGTTKTYNGLTIHLKHTTASTISAFDGTGLTLVYQANSTISNTPGWKDFVFSNSFTWNGTSNILISVCWDNNSASLGVNTHYGVTSFPSGPDREYIQFATSGVGCNLNGTGGSFTAPHTRFGIKPKITSFTPTSVCASSNQTVTITGKYFTGASAVSIGGTPASSFTVNSDVQITATVGSGTTGTISITTPRGTGTSSSSITVKQKPIATATPTAQSICSGSTTSVSLTSNVSGTTFSWLTLANTSITGESTTAQNSSLINNTLVNSTNSAITLNYTVTPTASGCAGTAITIPITVYPNPLNPTLNVKSPNTSNVCVGYSVSATFNSGTGGSGCSDLFEYSTNGSTWLIYAPGTSIPTTGLANGSNISIRGIRNNCTPSAGCTNNTASILVNWTVNAIPSTANAGLDISNCNYDSFSLLANIPTIGSGTWTLLNGNANIITPSNGTTLVLLSAGNSATLQWTINNGACSASTDQVVLNNHALPSVANAGVDQISCNQSNFTLTADNPIIGIGSWALSSGSASITNLSLFNTTVNVPAGDTAVLTWTVSNGNCPPNSDQVQLINGQIPGILINSNGTNSFCTGDSVLLNVLRLPSCSYQWLNNGQNIITATDTFYMVRSGASYTVLVTNLNNCNNQSPPFIIIENSNPVVSISNTGNPLICSNQTAVLNSNVDSAVSNYQWFFNGLPIAGATNSNITVNTAGNYSLNALDFNNCHSFSDSVQINVIQAPTAAVSQQGYFYICQGDSLVLSSLSNEGNLWSTGEMNQSITVYNSGTYTLVVTDSICSSVSSPVIVNVFSNPIAEIIDTLIYINSGSNVVFTNIQNDPNTSYKWQLYQNNVWIDIFDNSNYSGANTHQLTVYNVDSGNLNNFYRLIAANDICFDTSDVGRIEINNWNVPIDYIQEIEFEVYPNPFRDVLHVNLKNNINSLNCFLIIYNGLGRAVNENPLSLDSNKIILENNWPSGIYFLVIVNEDKKVIFRTKVNKL
jgi:hypothetical protein